MDKYQFSTLEQGSDAWLKARLGYFSGSMVGQLMKSARSKDKDFSDTAMDYIYDVASKRRVLPLFLDNEGGWEEYKNRITFSSKAAQFGKDSEDIARGEYERRNKVKVNECGFIVHSTIDYLGDSPDGIICDDKDTPVGGLEIKCPDPKAFVKYAYELSSGKSLKEVNPYYYWQCLCHMEVNDLQWVDFVAYDLMQRNGYYQTRIDLTMEVSQDIEQMIEKVVKANEIIEQINKALI